MKLCLPNANPWVAHCGCVRPQYPTAQKHPMGFLFHRSLFFAISDWTTVDCKSVIIIVHRLETTIRSSRDRGVECRTSTASKTLVSGVVRFARECLTPPFCCSSSASVLFH